MLVVDARRECLDANIASLEELRKGLEAGARRLQDTPLVVQYNKRDLSDGYAIDEAHRRMQLGGIATVESVACEEPPELPTQPERDSRSEVPEEALPLTPKSALRGNVGTLRSAPPREVRELDLRDAPLPARFFREFLDLLLGDLGAICPVVGQFAL